MSLLLQRIAALVLSFGVAPLSASAADRPNILWITSEDNASQWIGCYGNPDAQTPRIDAMAADGIKFTRAYSNGPVCAVARSTILNGAYAVTQGTEHMRSRHPIPASFKAGVTWLRENGYYCTNNAKTDYNFKGNDDALWDESSNKASFRNRPQGKPFFSVFNLNITHESQLFPSVVENNRKNGTIPEVPRLDPSKVFVPPYMPDLPEVRTDLAIYHDCVTAMDKEVGRLLDELKAEGLADDTIVFYYADHGGATARGKRYLQDTGTRVPLVIHIPEKWRKLSPFKPGTEVSEMVAFVDLAPTLLSLAGLKSQPPMQGRAFLGEHRVEPPADQQVFLFGDRFDDTDGMRRAITDGRYKYIRCFTPNLAGAPYSDYALGQPSWVAWREAWKAGKLSDIHSQIWKAPQPVEMLFDTASDRWEIKNLAADPAHAAKLAEMRGKLRETMKSVVDTGLVPEAMWDKLAAGRTIHDYVHSGSFDLEATIEMSFAASSSDPARLPQLVKGLSSQDPVIRFWAARGCLILGKAAAPASGDLVKVLEDKEPVVATVAAEALLAAGQTEKGTASLISGLGKGYSGPEQLFLSSAIMRLGLEDKLPADVKARLVRDPQSQQGKKQIAREPGKPGGTKRPKGGAKEKAAP